MEDFEATYSKLRDFSKVSNQDSISKGMITEKIVNQLIADIVKPFKQYTEENSDNIEFDGEIVLTKGKRLFYEIKLGTVPRFMVSRILEKRASLHYNRNTYFLIIAHSFSKMDQEEIASLIKYKEIKNGRISFIDYETLIALHKFSNKFSEKYKNDKQFKLCLLQRLFSETIFISQQSFENAFRFTEQLFPSIPTIYVVEAKESAVLVPHKDYYVERINRLEDLAQRLLDEVRKLKTELIKNS